MHSDDLRLSRRDFVALFSASMAAACTRPAEPIVPMAQQPEWRPQGAFIEYATAEPWRGFARGVVVRSFEGRPIKVEGNELHPASLGATGPEAQAAVLTLFDRARSAPLRRAGGGAAWPRFMNELAAQMRGSGEGVRILTRPTTSPTLLAQMNDLLQRFPAARWHQWDPLLATASARQGALIAFGRDVVPRLHVDRADIIVALDSDFLTSDPASLAYARAFGVRRDPVGMNRLYAAEPMPTATGAAADERLRCRATRIEHLAFAIAARLGVSPVNPELAPAELQWVDAAARDLASHRGRAFVIAGPSQPAHVHALTYMINDAIAAQGSTLTYAAPVRSEPVDPLQSLRELAADMHRGAVNTLLMIDANPVYDAPGTLGFGAALRNVRWSAHLSLYDDETSELSTWHVPQTHWLEQWSDLRAFDGTATIAQPLIAPLYGGWSAHEFIAAAAGNRRSGYDLVRQSWQQRDDTFWENSLREGVVADPAPAAETVVVNAAAVGGLAPANAEPPFEIEFRPDPFIGDGEHAANGWLQELPKPITKLVWDNAALISPYTAEQLEVENEELLAIEAGGVRVTAPVWIVSGHADDSVTLHFGYGRRRGSEVAAGRGANAFALRTISAPVAARVAKTAGRYALATTQPHGIQGDRDLVRVETLPGRPERELRDPPLQPTSLYPEVEYDRPAWAMVIDLSRCLDCGGCVAACNAENNIPFVGKEEVALGREMHWLRIDRYFSGSTEEPEIHHQPMLCMHCEKAPCEYVCPVAATVHSSEGLNEMVYNRCVGTRYCSNNCPYKVRRFNFYDYTPDEPEWRLRANPDVTIRSRGVMEKCTYCVQRISRARMQASKENRPIRDGEVVTACQAACPSRAIVFGDMNDTSSAVSQWKRDERNYALLDDLNTQPRTTYLTKIVNRAGESGER